MIRPARLSLIRGKAAWMQLKAPVALICNILSQSPGSISAMERCLMFDPALSTRMSSGPKVAEAQAKSRSTLFLFVTSAVQQRMGGSPVHRLAVSPSFSERRPLTATRHPS